VTGGRKDRIVPALSVPEHYTIAGLKARGWTDALIRQFLCEPDTLLPNPYYRSAPPMKCYRIARVEDVESTEAFHTAKGIADQRVARGKKSAQRQANRLLFQAETMPISVARLPFDDVQDRAIKSYNRFHMDLFFERGHDYREATRESNPRFLRRITANYVRHELTAYDRVLEKNAGRIGCHDAYEMIKRRVMAEIERVYPELKDNS
jgi:hypothetical protein